MPWLEPISLPFTHIDIAARVPSESGVYGIVDGHNCVFVGEAWNLKARLLEHAAVLSDVNHLTIIYELSPDDERVARKTVLAAELTINRSEKPVPLPALPGINLSSPAER
jgi:excinuclease UvrABC nuclease subunit